MNLVVEIVELYNTGIFNVIETEGELFKDSERKATGTFKVQCIIDCQLGKIVKGLFNGKECYVEFDSIKESTFF